MRFWLKIESEKGNLRCDETEGSVWVIYSEEMKEEKAGIVKILRNFGKWDGKIETVD